MTPVRRYLDPVLIERLQQLTLSARRVVEGGTTGSHRSPVRGASIEFRQHRAYSPGDEPRRMDWRVLARTDRPYVKEYDEETNLRAVLLLDCSASMGYGTGESQKLAYASRLVAALAYLLLGQTESVGVGLAGQGLGTWVRPRGGTPQLAAVVDALDTARCVGRLNLPEVVKQLSGRLERRSLVVLVSDLLTSPADVRSALARLRHARHESIVIRVLHRDEREFPFTHWTRFEGVEGEAASTLEPAAARRDYLRRLSEHERELATAVRAAGGQWHAIESDQPLAEAITRMLGPRVGG